MDSLTTDHINAFAASLRGKLLLPGDPAYDETRQIWNAMIDRRPSMIVRAAGTADVMATVNFARTHALPLSVRGGGHNIAGNAIADDAVMLDMALLKWVHVNPVARVAQVAAGATLHDVDMETQAFGLATPLGINSTTGIAGLTLGGGFGWLSRMLGLTVDNLLSADVVTADGKFVHTDRDNEPELFWAIRGGGGNFGVVTQFEFQLHPVGPEVVAGLLVFPFAQAKQVLSRYREYVENENMPERLSVWAVLRDAPPLPFLAPSVHGQKVIVLALLYAGDTKEGLRLAAQLRDFGSLHGEHVGAMPYTAWQQAFDPLLTFGARNYWKSHNFTTLSDGAIDTVLRYVNQLPSPESEIFLGLLGGATNRSAPDATAYPHRDALYVMNVHTRWRSPAEDKACIDWARAFFVDATPFASGGVYVNFLTQDEAARTDAAYGPNFQRLVQAKNRYDPNNLFRLNQNIKPTASTGAP